MARGQFRTANNWAMVDYGKHQFPIVEAQYRLQQHEPPFEMLPSEEEWKRAEQAKAAKQNSG